MEYTIKDYSTKEKPTWCPWCGDFTILSSLKASFAQLQLPPEKIALIAGIWCGSLIPYWVNVYWVCSLHWRSIPFAKWVKMANKNLTVVVNAWDWDWLWIWMGHYAHLFRRNIDLTVIIDNNWTYWLTKGQTSPTAKQDTISSSTPFWSLELPVNWLAVALTMWSTFVARAYAWDAKWLTDILAEAISHKWTAIVDVLQPCVTFNKVETYEFYIPRVENQEDFTWKNIIKTRQEAYELVTTVQEKIPVWVFFREQMPTYEDRCFQMDEQALVDHDIENIDVKSIMERHS